MEIQTPKFGSPPKQHWLKHQNLNSRCGTTGQILNDYKASHSWKSQTKTEGNKIKAHFAFYAYDHACFIAAQHYEATYVYNRMRLPFIKIH